jgi:hypothetical protein
MTALADETPEPNSKTVTRFLDEHCIGGYLLIRFNGDNSEVSFAADSEVYASALFKTAQDWLTAFQGVHLTQLVRLIKRK